MTSPLDSPKRYRTSDLLPYQERMERAKYPRKILCCGSREYIDRQTIRDALQRYLPEDLGADEPTVIHGAARGADRLVGEEALDLGFWVERFPADWKRNGKAAGVIRNNQMLDRDPDLVLAFGDGRGTNHTVNEACRRGIQVVRFS